MLPTLIDLCGLHIDDGLMFDGLSLANAFQESVEPPPERMTVVQYGHANEGTNGHTEKDNAAVLWQKWRLVERDGTLRRIYRYRANSECGCFKP